MPDTIVVTGGCGFIGNQIVRAALDRGFAVVTLDALTYAATRKTLADIDDHPGHTFVHGSIADRELMDTLLTECQPIAIINSAAATHVDRSIDGPRTFVDTNICGVFELLESTRRYYRTLPDQRQQQFRFLQISTDEVFGPVPLGQSATELAPQRPSSPYSASKAAADDLVHAWHVTYGLPTLISHCTNNYGPYQFPEKLIPHMIIRALRNMPLPLYGNGVHRREWLHVKDHINGLFAILTKGSPGKRYNLGSGKDCTNVELVKALCSALDKRIPRPDGRPHSEMIIFVKDRPGHDQRYSVDITTAKRELEFEPTIPLKEGLAETVNWYVDTADWWQPLIDDGYTLRRLGTGEAMEDSCDAA